MNADVVTAGLLDFKAVVGISPKGNTTAVVVLDSSSIIACFAVGGRRRNRGLIHALATEGRPSGEMLSGTFRLILKCI